MQPAQEHTCLNGVGDSMIASTSEQGTETCHMSSSIATSSSQPYTPICTYASVGIQYDMVQASFIFGASSLAPDTPSMRHAASDTMQMWWMDSGCRCKPQSMTRRPLTNCMHVALTGDCEFDATDDQQCKTTGNHAERVCEQ